MTRWARRDRLEARQTQGESPRVFIAGGLEGHAKSQALRRFLEERGARVVAWGEGRPRDIPVGTDVLLVMADLIDGGSLRILRETASKRGIRARMITRHLPTWIAAAQAIGLSDSIMPLSDPPPEEPRLALGSAPRKLGPPPGAETDRMQAVDAVPVSYRPAPPVEAVLDPPPGKTEAASEGIEDPDCFRRLSPSPSAKARMLWRLIQRARRHPDDPWVVLTDLRSEDEPGQTTHSRITRLRSDGLVEAEVRRSLMQRIVRGVPHEIHASQLHARIAPGLEGLTADQIVQRILFGDPSHLGSATPILEPTSMPGAESAPAGSEAVAGTEVVAEAVPDRIDLLADVMLKVLSHQKGVGEEIRVVSQRLAAFQGLLERQLEYLTGILDELTRPGEGGARLLSGASDGLGIPGLHDKIDVLIGMMGSRKNEVG